MSATAVQERKTAKLKTPSELGSNAIKDISAALRALLAVTVDELGDVVEVAAGVRSESLAGGQRGSLARENVADLALGDGHQR